MAWHERFTMVGGMPAVVARDAGGASAAEYRSLQRDLVQTYRDDFAKYAGRLEYRLLDPVLLAVLATLGKKIVYGRVGAGVKAHQAKMALERLATARLCQLIPHASARSRYSIWAWPTACGTLRQAEASPAGLNSLPRFAAD